jgi:hypothetical protein
MSGTSTQTQNPGLFNQMLAMGSIAATAFSDRRLKTDVSLVGEHRGLNLYRYRYKWEDRPRVGVMADEVARVAPEALGAPVNGYATVDYGKLGLAHLVGA